MDMFWVCRMVLRKSRHSEKKTKKTLESWSSYVSIIRMTKALDINYKFLIATFVIAIPIHIVNAVVIYQTNKPFFLIFCGLVIVGLGLVPLFHHLMEKNRWRSYIQNILTLWNVIMVIWSTWSLLNYFTNGL